MNIKPYSRFSGRHDIDLTNHNEPSLSLTEAAQRWMKDGQFLMKDKQDNSAYEGKTADLSDDSFVGRLSKIEAALAGRHLTNDVKAAPAGDKPSEPSSTSESAPSSE